MNIYPEKNEEIHKKTSSLSIYQPMCSDTVTDALCEIIR